MGMFRTTGGRQERHLLMSGGAIQVRRDDAVIEATLAAKAARKHREWLADREAELVA